MQRRVTNNTGKQMAESIIQKTGEILSFLSEFLSEFLLLTVLIGIIISLVYR